MTPRHAAVGAVLLALAAAGASAARPMLWQTSSYPELATLTLDARAYWLTFSPDGRHAFVALSGTDRVAVVDAPGRRVVDHLSAGAAPKRNLVIDVDARPASVR